MHDFTLPTNIKQIGSIENGLRIYMEDYVCTFLQQYAMAGGFEERIAYLVGKHMLIDAQPFLFISGAIYGKHAEKVEGYTRFTKQSAEYAEEMLEEYFPGMEIVGWMQSQPGYGTYLNQHYGAYHLRQFTKAYQVLFVNDPLEKTNAFYLSNPNAITPADRLAELSGYFIYYEKNVNMHEYMLTNTAAEYAPVDNKSGGGTAFASEGSGNCNAMSYNPDKKDAKVVELVSEQFYDDTDYYTEEPKIRPRSTRPSQNNKNSQKRQTNMLASVCAVLFVVAFVMGIGLIRNQDRLDQMENEIRQLITAHRNLFTQLNSQDLTPVFAEAPQAPPEPEQQVQEEIPVLTEEPELVVLSEPDPEPEVTYEPPLILVRPDPEPSPHPPVYDDEVGLFIPLTYVIQAGDSLSAISLRFFGTVDRVGDILMLNGMDNPDHIVVGRTIALPQP